MYVSAMRLFIVFPALHRSRLVITFPFLPCLNHIPSLIPSPLVRSFRPSPLLLLPSSPPYFPIHPLTMVFSLPSNSFLAQFASHSVPLESSSPLRPRRKCGPRWISSDLLQYPSWMQMVLSVWMASAMWTISTGRRGY